MVGFQKDMAEKGEENQLSDEQKIPLRGCGN